MIEVVLNDRLGKKVRVKCNEDDTIGDLKKLVAAQTGTRTEKIRIQKCFEVKVFPLMNGCFLSPRFGNPLEDAGLVIFGLLNERYAQCFDVHKLFFCGISNPVDDNAFF
ncbi:hypothetical protein Csa_022891 [Cucumis sativus]|nr:hypothetical protein Csa_022891 [Cucumis sativus]